jgi:hypothetical protein
MFYNIGPRCHKTFLWRKLPFGSELECLYMTGLCTQLKHLHVRPKLGHFISTEKSFQLEDGQAYKKMEFINSDKGFIALAPLSHPGFF